MKPDPAKMQNFLCPCTSGKVYKECCNPYHEGELPGNALLLMRSRYSAYALSNADYIIATTHPGNPAYSNDTEKWKKEICLFSQKTDYQKLDILNFQDGEKEAFVTFVAYLKQSEKDETFTEKSHFLKIQGKWLYYMGKFAKGRFDFN